MPKPNKNITVMIKGDKVEAYSQMKNITDNHPSITKTMLYWRWKNKYPVDFEGWKIHKVKMNKAFDE